MGNVPWRAVHLNGHRSSAGVHRCVLCTGVLFKGCAHAVLHGRALGGTRDAVAEVVDWVYVPGPAADVLCVMPRRTRRIRKRKVRSILSLFCTKSRQPEADTDEWRGLKEEGGRGIGERGGGTGETTETDGLGSSPN